MLTDYKISGMVERRGILTVKVKFYEGKVTTEEERDPVTMKTSPVTRYRRSAMIGEKSYEIFTGEKGSEDALKNFLPTLDQELSRDKKRTPLSLAKKP